MCACVHMWVYYKCVSVCVAAAAASAAAIDALRFLVVGPQ